MQIREFVQRFPDITIKDLIDSSIPIRDDLTQVFRTLESIINNYNLDDIQPDQLTPLLNELKSIVAIIKK